MRPEEMKRIMKRLENGEISEEYNAHIGGVDLMDSFIGQYRIRIKSRKWTTRLFYHLLDMIVINAWVLYKKVNTVKGKLQKNIMKLADFRTELADTLCRYQSHSKNKRGRPSTNSRQDTTVPSKRPRTGVQVLPSTDVRCDCIGHEKIFMDSRNKCKFNNCRKLISWFCKKCKVSLCDNKNNRMFRIISCIGISDFFMAFMPEVSKLIPVFFSK